MLVAGLLGEFAVAGRYLLVAGVLTAVGWSLSRLEAPAQMQANETFVLAVASFVTASLVMTWPLMAAGLSFIDALLETISGCTTTGLTTLTGVQPLNSGP